MSKKVISIVAIVALVAVLGVCLIACNESTYESKLEKAGYEVEVASQEDLEEMATEYSSLGVDMNIKWAVGATKGDEFVTVIAFETKEQAEAFANMVNLAAGFTGYKTEINGKILFYGTEQGIKDAK